MDSYVTCCGPNIVMSKYLQRIHHIQPWNQNFLGGSVSNLLIKKTYAHKLTVDIIRKQKEKKKFKQFT